MGRGVYFGVKFGVREARSSFLSIAVEGGEVTHRKRCLQKQPRVVRGRRGALRVCSAEATGRSLSAGPAPAARAGTLRESVTRGLREAGLRAVSSRWWRWRCGMKG